MHLCMVFAQLCATPAKSQPPPHPDPPHPPIMTLKTFCPSLTPIALGITLRPCLWSSKPRWKLRQELWAVSQSPDQESGVAPALRRGWLGNGSDPKSKMDSYLSVPVDRDSASWHNLNCCHEYFFGTLAVSLGALCQNVNYCLHSILIWELIQRKVSSYNPQVKTRLYKTVPQLHMVTRVSHITPFLAP